MSGSLDKIDEVYSHVDNNFESYLEILKRVIRQPSISHTGEGMAEMADLALELTEWCGAEDAEIWPEKPEPSCYPVVWGKVKSKNPKAKTIVVYSMYDVMPTPDANLWVVPPFSAEIVEGTKIGLSKKIGKVIVCRGVNNSKASFVAKLIAIRALRDVNGDVPLNIILAHEGEEERSSFPTWVQWRDHYKDELKIADAAFSTLLTSNEDEVGAGGVPERVRIILGLWGMVHVLLEVTGGEWGGPTYRDLGASDEGWVDAPIHRLVKALATLWDEEGEIAIKGFFDDIRPPNEEEKEQLKIIVDEMDEEKVERELGVKRFRWGKSPKELYEKRLMKATINLHALKCGFVGPTYEVAGKKFISTLGAMPHKVDARLMVEFTKNADPYKQFELIKQHLVDHGYPEVEASIMRPPKYPAKVSIKSPLAQAMVRTTRSFGYKELAVPYLYSSSAVNFLAEPPLNLPIAYAMIGYGGRSHSTNEFIAVEAFRAHIKWIARLFCEFAK